MAIDLADEIVQDFLVEAGEILEQLGEQLVELETSSTDADLLNAVFRGFHTIKGGAGFIGLDAMVEVCHKAEDTFNLLRQGERDVDAPLMDVMLRVLDVLNGMFESLNDGEDPEPAPPELQAQLARLAANEGPEEGAADDTPSDSPPAEGPLSEAEYQHLLDGVEAPAGEVAGKSSEQPSPVTGGDDEISEDEFEALLDELHGAGKRPGVPEASPGPDAPAGENIDEDEFEQLLDTLHGQGKPPAGQSDESEATASAPVRVKAAPAPGKAVAPAQGGDAAPRKSGGEGTVRVDTGVLDRIMNMVGELVLVRNRIATLEASQTDEEMAKAVSNLDVVTADLQSAVMRTRMQPIRKVFGRFPRVVRDLARNLGKDVELVMQGEDTDLDKNLVDALADPMVHLVRNAVDHGIEMPDVREAAGKPRKGRVTLSAEQEGDHILLTVEDDGAGMDPEVLRRKAVEKGLMDREAAARLDHTDCFNLIFAAGFSTRAEISDVSGRGVGMDVVKNRIAQLNGSVVIDAQPGAGTRLRIKVPLTLAIVPTLMVVLGNQIFALPLVNVNEIFDLDLSRTNRVDGQLAVVVRGKPLPLFYLNKWLVHDQGAGDEPRRGHVVVVHAGTRMMGFVVDQLLGQEEVVIKPLGALLQGTKGLAGATITGDGRIALILDVPGLVATYARRG